MLLFGFFIGHEKIVLNFLMNNAMSMTSGHETQAVGQGTCANNLFWVRLIFKERERKTSQELRMLSPSLCIQRSKCNCSYCCSQLSEM